MTAADRAALLRSPLFEKLPKEFFEKCRIITAEKGETLMSEESFSRGLALIIRGSAAVSKVGLDGKRSFINKLSAGDIFGMATLFYEKEKFPSEILAEGSLRLAVFPKETIEEAFSASPEFAKAYAVLLSEKIHFLNKKIADFSEGEAPEKLLRHLLSIAPKGQEEFELSCSLSHLAQVLGIGRASVYRAFDALIARGDIAKEGKKIVVLKR